MRTVKRARIDSSQGLKRVRFKTTKETMFDDFSNPKKIKNLMLCAEVETFSKIDGKEVNVVLAEDGRCIGYQSIDGNIAFNTNGELMVRGQ